MTHIWHKVLAKWDIGNGIFGTGAATERTALCTGLLLFWKVLLTRGGLIKWACGMGAVRLGAKTGFGMGRTLG